MISVTRIFSASNMENNNKKFTGRVINSPADLIGCGSCCENAEVTCSEVLDITG